MMGSGKTTLGERLADKLGWRFIDLDSEITSAVGKSIPKIFEQNGEAKFRTFETEALKRTSMTKDTVIATGGGIVLEGKNCHLMRDSGEVIFLKTSRETLKLRLEGVTNRPLLNSEKSLEDIWDERKPLYENAATFIADGNEPVEVCITSIISSLA